MKRDGCPVAPVLVTQENCTAAVGLTRRRYLDLVAGHPRLLKVGKLRALPVDDLVALLRDRAGANDTDDAPSPGRARRGARDAGEAKGGVMSLSIWACLCASPCRVVCPLPTGRSPHRPVLPLRSTAGGSVLAPA